MDENPTLDSVSSKVWIDFISGWGSGAASILLCQPIDTILTRYQATKVSSFANTKNFVFYSSKDLVSQYGVKSLWRGTSAMIGAVPLQNALLMSGYGFGSKWASKYNKSFEPSTHDSKGWSQEQIEYSAIFFGGCLGGFIQSFLMSPVELIKVKQQVVGKSVYDATMAVTSGISSYSIGWRGIEATILRDGIPHGVWFVSYEYCKRSMIIFKDEFCDGGDNAPINWNEVPVGADVSILSGAFAATVAWLVGYPAGCSYLLFYLRAYLSCPF